MCIRDSQLAHPRPCAQAGAPSLRPPGKLRLRRSRVSRKRCSRGVLEPVTVSIAARQRPPRRSATRWRAR
eukprot:8248292-Alexandrium_andersonii.AAC.1